MITGKFVSRAVYAAARLRLADLLADGPRTAAELAASTGNHAPSLQRLLRALAGSESSPPSRAASRASRSLRSASCCAIPRIRCAP
jgi:hypothetical protein